MLFCWKNSPNPTASNRLRHAQLWLKIASRIDKVNTFAHGIYYEKNGVLFVCNERKAISNLRKHEGITFEQATEAFFDPFLKLVDAGCNAEARDAVIGYDSSERLLFVVPIEIEGEPSA